MLVHAILKNRTVERALGKYWQFGHQIKCAHLCKLLLLKESPPPFFQVINNSVWVLVSAFAWIIRATWMILAGLEGWNSLLSDRLHRQWFSHYPKAWSLTTFCQSTFSPDSSCNSKNFLRSVWL